MQRIMFYCCLKEEGEVTAVVNPSKSIDNSEQGGFSEGGGFVCLLKTCKQGLSALYVFGSFQSIFIVLFVLLMYSIFNPHNRPVSHVRKT